MQVQISAVIITYNEEKNIARCIDSLFGIVDEILVVDSFSKDQTKEICLQKNVKFVEHHFKGYARQKNLANDLAVNDIILSLDADEALSEELKASVLQIKSNWTADGYSMARLTNYCGTWIRYCGWYPDNKIRLFDKRKAKWGGDAVHEVLEFSASSKIDSLSGDILHYSYYSLSDHLRQIDKFTSLAADSMLLKGKVPNLLHFTLRPFWKFIHIYILRLGFLDGFAGYCIAKNSAYAIFLKYSKLKMLRKVQGAR